MQPDINDYNSYHLCYLEIIIKVLERTRNDCTIVTQSKNYNLLTNILISYDYEITSYYLYK